MNLKDFKAHNFVYRERMINDHKVVEINTRESTFFGRKWKDLGSFGKRKFENLVFLSYQGERVKICYGF